MLLHCALLSAPFAYHLPHDDVHDVACGPLPGGGVEVVITTNSHSKILRSVDDGLSWSILAGDGLEFREGNSIEYWQNAADPRFFIGTDDGVWTYHPATGSVVEANAGLDPADRCISDLATPRRGPGPAVLVTTGGAVYAWQESSLSWSSLLRSGESDPLARVAIAPDFDPLAAAGPDRSVVAGIAGCLHRSDDGGASWTTHSQFSQPATLPTDWWLTALAFADDFRTSGVLVVGRGREDQGSLTGDGGEIWRSSDFGASFALAMDPGSAVRALISTPPDPSGLRFTLAALQAMPKPSIPGQNHGVLSSTDDGLTWSDGGNHQDFYLENEDALGTREGREWVLGMAVSPEFGADGQLFLGRSAGLYRSDDSGNRWRQVAIRSPSHVRAIDTGTDSQGHRLAFGAAFGSGLARVDLDTQETTLLGAGPIIYGRSVSVSPQHGLDGGVAVAGEGGVAWWFDPAVPPANPFGVSGWKDHPMPSNGRVVRLHPRFDASGTLPGGNQVMFCSFMSVPPLTLRSHDGGLSAELLWQLQGAPFAPYMRRMEIAPTYDPAEPTTCRDVYGVTSGGVVRLEGDTWRLIYQTERELMDLAIDPFFSREVNPRLFVADFASPEVWQVMDLLGGVSGQQLDPAGLDGQVRDIALPPDFDQRPVVYVTTWGSGVWKYDLAAATPRWEPVGGPLPAIWLEPLAFTSSWTTDRSLVVGTQYGVYLGQDLPGAPWVAMPAPFLVEDGASGIDTFDPNEPTNPAPERVWPWHRLKRWPTIEEFGIEVIGLQISYTDSDGAYLEWEGIGRRFELRSIRGPGMGTARLSAFDFASGALLASVTEDLAAAAPAEAWSVALDLPNSAAVRFRVEALLDPGERLAVDALGVCP
ncbi:MAG: hypothetical protein ISR76_04755 [Planctomycetes bacterium]|nr:hypothetical protein [Planctomycetota bacterium]MBL7008285.1 hypothetical protein [Planctomycetota bacterium]